MIIGFPGHDAPRRTIVMRWNCCRKPAAILGSRLFLRIREKLGPGVLCRRAEFPGLAPGFFAFYVGTAPEKVELVEKRIIEGSGTAAEEGLTEEELKRAKAKIIGQKKIARQDLGGYAMSHARWMNFTASAICTPTRKTRTTKLSHSTRSRPQRTSIC